MNVRADLRNPFHSGGTLRANYTWSHAIDNLSSTFSESPNNLNLGLLDPFNKRLDTGDADFDIRTFGRRAPGVPVRIDGPRCGFPCCLQPDPVRGCQDPGGRRIAICGQGIKTANVLTSDLVCCMMEVA